MSTAGFRFADVVGKTRYEMPEIGPGVWIELRNELTVFERRQMIGRCIKGQTPTDDGKFRTEYDMALLPFSTVIAYLSDWSQAHVPDRAERVEVSESALKALSQEHFAAIERVVEAHVKKFESSTTMPLQMAPTSSRTKKRSDVTIS